MRDSKSFDENEKKKDENEMNHPKQTSGENTNAKTKNEDDDANERHTKTNPELLFVANKNSWSKDITIAGIAIVS